MRLMTPALIVILAILPAAPSVAQTSSDIEQAVRTGRRAADEYRRQSEAADYAASQRQIAAGIAEARVKDAVCKPMWRQTALSRREYIESITTKKSARRAYMNVCYTNELSMYGFCSPKEWGDYQGVAFPDSCVGKREDWPKPPDIKDYITRLDEFHKAEESYRALVASKYR